MAINDSSTPDIEPLPETAAPAFVAIRIPLRLIGLLILALVALCLAALSSWNVDDPSLSYATDAAAKNWIGFPGAVIADIWMQFLGLTSLVALLPPAIWGWGLSARHTPGRWAFRLGTWILGTILAAGALSFFPVPETWPLPTGLGGLAGNLFPSLFQSITGTLPTGGTSLILALILLPATTALIWTSMGLSAMQRQGHAADTGNPSVDDAGSADADRTGFFDILFGGLVHLVLSARTAWRRTLAAARNRRNDDADLDWQAATGAAPLAAPDAQDASAPRTEQFVRQEPRLYQEPRIEPEPVTADTRVEPPVSAPPAAEDSDVPWDNTDDDHLARLNVERSSAVPTPPAFVAPRSDASPNTPGTTTPIAPAPAKPRIRPGQRQMREAQGSLLVEDGFQLPQLSLLAPPKANNVLAEHHPDELEIKARQLEGVLEDFGIKGDIINVCPGPVVTLYELEPAPGIKSSRVISLADDIARSMSAVSARVAVIPGRNAIGIELPNSSRETVFLREMLASEDFEKVKGKLPICLGKTIGGEPVIADLARMPHLLIAGTTGSGKSVAVNTMILSLLYRMTPEQCRLIMIDPKMLELSVYDGIPHLLSPVVTDPGKAVVALKWAVREMEDRYKKMSKIGVRNIEGFNKKVREANRKGEQITRTVQTGFDRETGEAIYESESFELQPLPFIVVIVDEMADLMMVAGKDIEGAIQRLAQMARAAGIHLIMATQRPSVDVITGTIKANFPTRISFQVTSKIDSRTILGEQGAEQLLGMGDMLYMAGGGRIKRLHGPFVADKEVEDVVRHLKEQGAPDYLDSVTEEVEEAVEDAPVGSSGNELYDRAVNIVLNDRKASTSYIQRRLSIGYNRAATLIEKMEQEGVISPANHAGKREVLVGDGVDY